MKFRNIIIALVFSLFSEGTLSAQIELFTDRTLYSAGEDILFSALVRKSPETKTQWSTVIYLNLVSPDGTSVSRGKYPLSSSSAQGYLPVPDQLLTGNYYLVAYTRWMQNFNPANYEYKPIKIINPYSSDLEPSCMNQCDTLPYIMKSDGNSIQEVIECETERTQYIGGEKVNITFRLPGTVSPTASPFTVMAGSPDVMDNPLFTGILPDSISYQSSGTIRYIPDLMGMSISGKVVNRETGTPIQNVLVELSLLEQNMRFHACQTGEDGSFVFALDSMTGSKEMFIAVRESGAENLEILVDNDFAVPNFSFSPRSFSLSENEQKEATLIMLISQIRKRFQNENPAIPGYQNLIKGDFYGIPSTRILIDDYIQLPSLSEVFIEVVPGVQSITRNKERSLQFNGNVAKQNYMGTFKPLVLLDQVPVYDIEKLLALSPQKIYSIEVVDELYYLGNFTYGGIISITSKKGDMAGMDLPEGSFFFDFNTFQPQPALTDVHAANQDDEKQSFVLGNTLHWNPNLNLVPGRSTGLSLTAPDRSGSYLILVRGLSADGSLLQGRCSFRVE